MSKYNALFTDILEKTTSGKIEWHPAYTTKYANIIFAADTIFKSFESTYEKDKKTYSIVLVEKKWPDPEESYDHYSVEIHFIRKGCVVLSMDENVIKSEILMAFADTVTEKNADAKFLLGDAELPDYEDWL